MGSPAADESIPTRAAAVGAVDVEGSLVLFHAERRSLHTLNASARAVWEAIDGRTPVRQIAERLAEAFAGDAGQISSDVQRTIEILSSFRAVDFGPPPAARRPVAATAPRALARDWGRAAGAFRALDSVFEVRSSESTVLGRLARILEPLLDPARPEPAAQYEIRTVGPDRYTVRHGDYVLCERAEPASAVDSVLWHVNRLAAEGVTRAVCLHAAAVAWRDRIAVLPAVSEAGKSTLAAAMVAQGARYLSDELAAIDVDSGHVRPYPKALSLSAESVALIEPLAARLATQPDAHEWQIDPLDIGAIGAAGPVAAVIVPRYKADSPLVLETLTGLDALHALLDNSLPFDAVGGRGFEVLGGIASTVPVYRMTYSSLVEACRAVRDAVE